MVVADLLAVLESAHLDDAIRILAMRDGGGAQVAAIRVEDAMVVASEPRTVLIKPAVELRELEKDKIADAAAAMATATTAAAATSAAQHEVQLANQKAIAYRKAADQVLRNAWKLLSSGQAAAAERYLFQHLPENRTPTGQAAHKLAPAEKPVLAAQKSAPAVQKPAPALKPGTRAA